MLKDEFPLSGSLSLSHTYIGDFLLNEDECLPGKIILCLNEGIIFGLKSSNIFNIIHIARDECVTRVTEEHEIQTES